MRLLAYYIIRSFVNTIKRMFKKRVLIIIGMIFLFGAIIGGTVAVVTSNLDSSVEEPSPTFNPEEPSQGVNPEEPSLNINTPVVSNSIEGIIGIIALVVFLFCMYNGEKAGASIFLMPDVNFLFPAPIRPQSVLLFRIILHMGLALVSSIYIVFQIPNLVVNLGMPGSGAVAILVLWFFLLIIAKLISVGTYVVIMTKKHVKPIVYGIVYVLGGAVLLLYAGFVVIGKMSYYDAFFAVFSQRWTRLIPVWGWMKGIVMYTIEGNFLAGTLCVIGVIISIILGTYLIWKMKADFYEDAMVCADKKQTTLDAASEGRVLAVKRSSKLKREGTFGGEGANVILYKFFYNRKRFARFGLFTKTFEFYLMVLVATTGIMKFLQFENGMVLSCIMIVIIYIRSFANPMAEEMSKHYIFLIPESAVSKVAYSIASGSIDTLLNIGPTYLIASIVLGQNIIVSLCWILLFVAVDYLGSSIGLFLDMILPSYLPTMIRSMLQTILSMGFVVVLFLALLLTSVFAVQWVGVLISTAAAVVIGTTCSMISQTILHDGRR